MTTEQPIATRSQFCGRISEMTIATSMRPKPKVYGAIFDMDGTLLDTEELSRLAIDSVVRQFGKEFTMAMHKTILGRPAVEWTRLAIAAAGLSEEIITPDELFNQWAKYMQDMSHSVKELPGGVELLSALHARGIPLALATSNSKSVVETKKQHHSKLFSYFSTIVCGDDPAVKRGKPAPDIFRTAGQRLFNLREGDDGEMPPRCIVFEDSVSGYTAANAAGMHSIAIPDVRIYTDENLRAELFGNANEVITSLTQFEIDKYDWQL
ncbi:hypothetical protein PsorP6_002567 [Peronosclerospora sorghi]|uniref:Uncharacterized protein n=1 Tax=Peronosclerospora sorghi TaxID=230839 RepID=A0ACC0WXH1_9STRA|nr:hypothetical protein PsorP6_002567 [Peronosclerospora sorghi]